MTPGISTACFYPEHTEDALLRLAERGVEAAEVFFNCLGEASAQNASRLRKIADGGGTRILAVHPFTSGMEPMLFFSRYDRRFLEGRDLYLRYCEAANILGARILVFHGGFRQTPVTREEYFERFGRLAEDLAAEGVDLCHENVDRCTGWQPDFFRGMKKALPDAGFVLDVKQCVRAGVGIFEMADAMAGHLRHLHISDNTPEAECLPPGTGTFNIAELLFKLRKNAHDAGVIVELYRENFGEDVEIFASYQHLCRILSTC